MTLLMPSSGTCGGRGGQRRSRDHPNFLAQRGLPPTHPTPTLLGLNVTQGPGRQRSPGHGQS